MTKWWISKKEEHSEMYFKFMNHCAKLIQKHWRGYRTRVRFAALFANRRIYLNRRRALLIGWKTRSILKCKKVQMQIDQIRDIHRMIDVLGEEKGII